jgi:hypothetical protein
MALIGSLIFSPFSNEIRSIYSAIPNGFRAVLRARDVSLLRRARFQLIDGTFFIRSVLTRCSILILYLSVGLLRAVRDTNTEFDRQFRLPLSSADRALANSRSLIDFATMGFFVLSVIAVVCLVTCWQFRIPPVIRIARLEEELGKMSHEEELRCRVPGWGAKAAEIWDKSR